VLRAGAIGLAAWSVPTIRPIARTALPGSKPPASCEPETLPEPQAAGLTAVADADCQPSLHSTDPSSSSSVLGSDTERSGDPVSDPDTGQTYVETYEEVGELDVSGPAKPVSGEPDFTG
jgi:hypothetical protein